MLVSLPPVVIEPPFVALKPVVLETIVAMAPTILTIGQDRYGQLIESEEYPGLWS